MKKVTVETLKQLLKENKKSLDIFKVESLFVFGSVAKGKFKDDSDVDILVKFKEQIGLFEFLDLKYFLEDLFGLKVDLATNKALHPKLKKNIEEESIRVA